MTMTAHHTHDAWMIDESEFYELEHRRDEMEFLLRYAVLALDGGQIADIVDGDTKSVAAHVLRPGAAAAAIGIFVDVHLGRCGLSMSPGRRDCGGHERGQHITAIE